MRASNLAVERLLRQGKAEVAMRRTAEARSAGFARKALVARKEKISALAAGLRRGEDQLEGRRSDQLDRAADIEAHEVLSTLQAVEARELAEIDAALTRIAHGKYGACERCGGAVGSLRLRAVPEARLCMTCAARP
jgi:RNA polymerase-binding transcription factor DksA